jgi:nucleotide-binding universal stress UspA family protein
MRILIAYDGSPGSEQALALAGALPWPTDSTLRVASVVEGALAYYTGVRHELVAPSQIDLQLLEARQHQVTDAVGRLRRDGAQVDGVVLRGRPATVLADEAASFAADLLIAGSHGHGVMGRIVLGSVTAELTDTAPCPVLVARTGEIRSIVVAVDGSPAAEAAASVLETWPMEPEGVFHVLSVTEAMDPVEFGLAPAAYHAAAEQHAKVVAQEQAETSRIAEETAARLRVAGRRAQATTRTGRAAAEIMALAEETGADLIVMGSRGRTGIARIVLGSVARKVLNSSNASVLIVRSPRADPN